MSFEQLDHEHKAREEKKKKLEKEKTQEFWLEKQLLRETSDLLNKLAREISQEFWLTLWEVKNLISWDTSGGLEELRSHIWTPTSAIDLPKLKETISWAQNSIEQLSKKKIETLKSTLEQGIFTPEKHEFMVSKKIFSENITGRAQNPQNIWDELIWVGLGLIDSTEAVILFTYSLAKWVVLTPYHIYLVLTWQAKYDGFSKI